MFPAAFVAQIIPLLGLKTNPMFTPTTGSPASWSTATTATSEKLFIGFFGRADRYGPHGTPAPLGFDCVRSVQSAAFNAGDRSSCWRRYNWITVRVCRN